MTATNPLLEDDSAGALFDDGRTYRYRLWRTWDTAKPTVAFIMLNPSTADELTDDRTIRKCIGYAQAWGYGTLVVGNLFALRATDPEELYGHPDPVGVENDDHLVDIADAADQVIAAWGHHGGYQDRGRAVYDLLDCDLDALGTTQDGHPRHPLYLPADREPESFDGGDPSK